MEAVRGWVWIFSGIAHYNLPRLCQSLQKEMDLSGSETLAGLALNQIN